MPTEKIADWPFCTHSDHSPNKDSLTPGTYRHKCPACGHTEDFIVTPRKFRRKEAEPWPIQPVTPWPIQPMYPPFKPYTDPQWPPHRTEIFCMIAGNDLMNPALRLT